MAFFLLCFDAASPANAGLNSLLSKMKSAVNSESSIDLAPGCWVVVAPNDWTAKHVRMKYHSKAGPGEKLSVLSLDGFLSDRTKVDVDGAVLQWAARWHLPLSP